MIPAWTGDSCVAVTDCANAFLTDVAGVSGSDIWASGNKGALYHFDGVDWKRMQTGVSIDLWSVAITDRHRVLIGGQGGQILVR